MHRQQSRRVSILNGSRRDAPPPAHRRGVQGFAVARARTEDAVGYLEERANLTGKVAAIVGGAKGVGAAATKALAAAGVDVAFCDVDADALERTRLEVEQL